MNGFLDAAPLDELARSPAGVLDTARTAHEESEKGPDPVHAFLVVDFDPPAASPSGPLSGVPVAIKDNLATLGLPTTCGSLVLEGYLSPFEATAVRRLRAAGALIVGKTNLDEFGMGSSTEHSAYGPTRNPLDRARVPGGSSGGSAAAVAAGVVPVALGSDTGGSVRQPASFCGVVGLTPTYGRISRYGLIAHASSLDRVGILGRSVDDVACVLDVVGGHDPLDATSARGGPINAARALSTDVAGLVVSVPRELFPDTLHPEVSRACRAALQRLAGLGAVIRDVSLPNSALAAPAYQVIAAAETSSNLARFDGARFGVRADGGRVEEMYGRTRALFGREVKRRILLGAHVLAAGNREPHYRRAHRARALIADDFRRVFDSGVDVLFSPTTSTPAFELGERLRDAHAMHVSDALTVGASLSGLPAISLPVGAAGVLPIGGQLIGRRWDEATVLGVASALERSLARSIREI